MCTALFSLAQKKNEKEALAVPELTSRFRDFLKMGFVIIKHSSTFHNGLCLSSKSLCNINIHNIDIFVKNLLKINKINQFGLSIYDEKDIVQNDYINLLQIPGNIFNQSILSSEKVLKFVNKGGNLLVRSIFIQGLILMDTDKIPSHLSTLKTPIKKFQELSRKFDVLPEALAIAVVKELCPSMTPIIGCDNIEQLKHLKIIYNKKIDSTVISHAIDLGRKYYSDLWDPRLW